MIPTPTTTGEALGVANKPLNEAKDFGLTRTMRRFGNDPEAFSRASKLLGNPSGFSRCSNRASRYSLISGKMARLILSCQEASDQIVLPTQKHKPSKECMKTLRQGTHTAPPAVGEKGERVHYWPRIPECFFFSGENRASAHLRKSDV
jgi:hypothetical protein